MNGLVMFLLFLLIFFFFKKTSFYGEKMSSFECGFDKVQTQRNNFSLRFFSLTILFLLFDMEMSLFFPLPLFFNLSKNVFFFMIFLLVVSILIEWNQGSLEWK